MQPTPTVTRGDVERVIRRDFPAELFAQVLAVLDEYEHRERERVQLAVLKLAGGSMKRLRYEIEGAKCDYRDVLSPAEYPSYTKKMFRMSKLPAEEQQRIIDADWKQYQDCLAR
jgi:hypothetical protein